ncbi:MAG: ral secretion pathway protein [Patescibacteria group bacterium]|nr:ral secretion pathway protein [Patescibacteria group bacterium]
MRRGFTIVELLIVIVVIGILAAITLVAFNSVQAGARDSDRKAAVAALIRGLELYYGENGRYPTSSGSTTINASWSTTADASWAHLENQLRPYMGSVPNEPRSTPGVAAMNAGGYNFDYYANASNYCGAANGQMFILVYKLEKGSQVNNLVGDCTVNTLGPYTGSNYRVVK